MMGYEFAISSELEYGYKIATTSTRSMVSQTTDPPHTCFSTCCAAIFQLATINDTNFYRYQPVNSNYILWHSDIFLQWHKHFQHGNSTYLRPYLWFSVKCVHFSFTSLQCWCIFEGVIC